MNSIPKYVASRTLKKASWNASVIHGDIADEVRKLKSQPGKDIVKYGTGLLDRVLFAQRLVDLLCIIVYPFRSATAHTYLKRSNPRCTYACRT